MLFLILEGLLSGIFLLDDLFSIFILIEVSTLVASLLIMFSRDSRSMYDGLFYMIINIFAATFFLLGLAMLYKQTGTFSLQTLGRILPDVENMKPLYLPYALILTAVCLKAALMPLFSWLPKAHGTPSAPSVVSAVLSGLYVKNGLYLFIRCQSAFQAIDTRTFFLIAGAVTAIAGAVFAISQSDIKLILSYHTVSQIGLIMVALNLGGETSAIGGMYHIVNHALFKSVLVLGAGVIMDEYGTRNMYDIHGVFRRMPLIALAMIAAILGITGAPLFNGSVSKYLIQHDVTDALGSTVMLLINVGTIISFIKFSSVFFGDTGKKAKVFAGRTIVCLILGVLCLVFGVFGAPVAGILFGVDVAIDPAGYLKKSMVFLLSAGAAWLIYRFAVRGRGFWKQIRAFDFGFNTSALSVVLFFAAITGYLFLS
jgi:multicomponent Na+:H+ antiporter subunit D